MFTLLKPLWITAALGQPGGEGNGNPLQCSCLENPRDRGAWRAAVCGVAQSQTRLKRLSSSSITFMQLSFEISVSLTRPQSPRSTSVLWGCCILRAQHSTRHTHILKLGPSSENNGGMRIEGKSAEVLVRYLGECLSFGICLKFFSWLWVLRRKITEVKCCSDPIVSRAHAIDTTCC